MKNIFLSVVIVATLVAAGVGGTLADFSDIEISEDNKFATGALDLVLSDYMGQEYQNATGTVPAMFHVVDAIPCCSKDIKIDLHNEGQGFQFNPHVYLHIKNLDCGWVVPKQVWAWVDETGATVPAPDPEPPAGTQQGDRPDFPKPLNEPEYVGELGGLAGEDVNGNPVYVPGVGLCYGEDCQLARHVEIEIRVAGPYPCTTMLTAAEVPDVDWVTLDLSRYDTDDPLSIGIIKLSELECEEIGLGSLPYSTKIWVNLVTHLQDIDEDLIFDPGFFDETIYEEAKWDHWPTNALQKDYVEFDMAFELFQNPLPPRP
jgi:predicted ribosomally synthesized peptide with SipW-like signal peptide